MNTRKIQMEMDKGKKMQDLDIDYQNGFIVERENEIKQLNEDVKALNDIFKQMATVVNRQSEGVNTIVTHITNTHENVKYANEKLEAAEKEQNKFSCRIL